MATESPKRPIRVLIIDDSATMRGLMAHALQKDPDLEVVGYAGDAYGAREAIKKLDPDVVTLDIEMPRMDGLTFLEKLMRLNPIPAVVVTSKTESMEEIEYSALQLGAAHCLFKPQGASGAALFAALPQKIKDAVEQGIGPKPKKRGGNTQQFDGRRAIFFGASTGGVDALVSVLKNFPRNCPPTMIVQHMPEKFIQLFAQRLNSVCEPDVKVAQPGMRIAPGTILIGPAGIHLRLSSKDSNLVVLEDTPPVHGFRPSVDILFKSAAEMFGKHAVGALLTGMGRDGAEGLLALRNVGAVTVAQDEKSSVVYGMPRVAFEMGAIDTPLPLDEIANAVLEPCRPQQLRNAS